MHGAGDDSPTKVAIVGGGCAALAAAFELSRPELAGRYCVTVYQMGFRLGGKGASGRGLHGRIEEHGLHLWMGYYENAFRLMRECYAELALMPDEGRRLPFEEAFLPAHYNGAMDWSPRGKWTPWKVEFPAMPGMPGDPDPPVLSVPDCLAHAARLLGTLLTSLRVPAIQAAVTRMNARESRVAFGANDGDLESAVAELAQVGVTAGLAAALEGLGWLKLVLGGLPRYPQSVVARLLDVVTALLRAELAKLADADDGVRRVWEVADLILATIRGAIRFRIAFDPRGFDAIDDYDCREWLKLNGASEGALNSAFMRALYDLAFAYVGGDPECPAIAAGTALRGAFRAFFSYRGAFFWKMAAGMGDIVFAPLYRVLRQRGVRFEFFHKLVHIGLSSPADESAHVASLEFDVQARTTNGDEYRALVDVQGLPCWPAQARFEQLAGGAELEAADVDLESQWDRRFATSRILHVGTDFDFVVLGVGVGVLRSVCGAILERDERWRDMVEHVTSVPTQAFQLWLDRDLSALGWGDRSINLSGFVEPFDTWADMSHVLPFEAWPTPPKTVAYFCNVLRDEEAPDTESASHFVARSREDVRKYCVSFLQTHVQVLWPAARREDGGFAWDYLVPADDAAAPGPTRFGSQYFTANVRPSDRYTQCLPGSTKFRISPLDRTYDNLTVAGDWTNSSLNMGCVEAAVMSGRLAAHALSGLPRLADIVGYDHP
jgi:uncharacterized protein with NAD-binding domain and iron-sulfur cluster